MKCAYCVSSFFFFVGLSMVEKFILPTWLVYLDVKVQKNRVGGHTFFLSAYSYGLPNLFYVHFFKMKIIIFAGQVFIAVRKLNKND